MIQTGVFVILAGACVAASAAAWKKKWCPAPFYMIMAATIFLCLAGVLVSGRRENHETRSTLNENLYIAGRLMEEGKSLKSVSAASQALIEYPGDRDAILMKALALNKSGSYTLSADLLKNNTDDRTRLLADYNSKKEPLPEQETGVIIKELTDKLQLTKDEKEQYELLLHLSYLDNNGSVPAGISGGRSAVLAKARAAGLRGDYGEAFELVKNLAEKGDFQGKLLLSEMFVNQYSPHNYRSSDEEMDALLARVTKLQIELEELQAAMGQEEGEKTYALKQTEYKMAKEQLDRAPALRAINYIKSEKVAEADNNIAYNLQLAKLYFFAGEEVQAQRYLDNIFRVQEIDEGQWLGTQCRIVQDGYIQYLKDLEGEAFYKAFELLYESLSNGMELKNRNMYESFREFLSNYLHSLYTGIRINEMEIKAYPSVRAILSYSGRMDGMPDELTEDNLKVYDQGTEIKDFSLEKSEDSLLYVALVLDKSGSMRGERIEGAKRALMDFIDSVKEEGWLSLTVFDRDAVVLQELTDSQSAVKSALDPVKAAGGTHIADALQTAAGTLEEVSGSKAIVLLSDGYDGSSDAMNPVLADLAGKNIPVYTICLPGSDTEYMQHIAETSNGASVMADNPAQLRAIYQMIYSYLFNHYILTYEAVEQKEEKERILRVEVAGEPAFDDKEYYVGISEEKAWAQRVGEPSSNYYRQIGGSGRGGEE